MNPFFNLPRRQVLQSAAAAVAALGFAVDAQADEPASPKKTGTTPRLEDVASIDSIIGALYDVISGDKGQARDWARFQRLFAEGARLIHCLPKNESGLVVTKVLTPAEFARSAAAATAKRGFYEKEVARKTDRFGHIAQVFSTYVSSETRGGDPFAKGINSIQLQWDEKRWWVVTIFWDAETPDQPIPPEYQPSK